MTRALIFPGQGSHAKGMGRQLFDSVAEFARNERRIDELLGYSLREMCLMNPRGQLMNTRFAQPCLYVVNALHFFQTRALGQPFSYLAGHSLGEYNALLAADAFDFLTGLHLVKQRGALMAEATDGGMAAVVGIDVERIAMILDQNGFSDIRIANFNAPMQTVISGPKGKIESIGAIFQNAGASLYFPLSVSAAFHSPLMTHAAEAFRDTLSATSFRPLKVPVISNVSGDFYPAHASSRQIAELLVTQITSPVRWMDGVRCLLEHGVTDFVETGPGNVLSKLVSQTRDCSEDRGGHRGPEYG